MSNVFSASFDELLAQAGVPTSAVSQATETQATEQTTVETSVQPVAQPDAQPDAQPATQHDVQPPTQVPSFDDLLTQAGITTQPADATTEDAEATNVTETYRVDTDVFGDNDTPATTQTSTNQTVAPNASTSFDDLLAQAGTTKPKAKEEAKAKAEEEAKAKESKPKAKTKAKKAQAKESTLADDSLLDEDTVAEIKAEIRQVVRDAVRDSFKEAIADLANAFK